jgi:hypothetical protein
VGPRAVLNMMACRESNLGCPVRSSVTILTELPLIIPTTSSSESQTPDGTELFQIQKGIRFFEEITDTEIGMLHVRIS